MTERQIRRTLYTTIERQNSRLDIRYNEIQKLNTEKIDRMMDKQQQKVKIIRQKG